ncbi:hypothetical protein BJ912DRAFT_215722 [Pholiota molesta]|nr:hypothetical protein BJ912DRAFT_215722 [Pholiota molesta]
MMLLMLMRGRPRIDAELVMLFNAVTTSSLARLVPLPLTAPRPRLRHPQQHQMRRRPPLPCRGGAAAAAARRPRLPRPTTARAMAGSRTRATTGSRSGWALGRDGNWKERRSEAGRVRSGHPLRVPAPGRCSLRWFVDQHLWTVVSRINH